MVDREAQCVVGMTTTAAQDRVGNISPERRRVEAVDDWVTACVQVAKHKQNMVHVLWRVLDDGWLEPVPNPQEVVRRPANDEGANNHYGHL